MFIFFKLGNTIGQMVAWSGRMSGTDTGIRKSILDHNNMLMIIREKGVYLVYIKLTSNSNEATGQQLYCRTQNFSGFQFWWGEADICSRTWHSGELTPLRTPTQHFPSDEIQSTSQLSGDISEWICDFDPQPFSQFYHYRKMGRTTGRLMHICRSYWLSRWKPYPCQFLQWWLFLYSC